jgi:hypothetical protein
MPSLTFTALRALYLDGSLRRSSSRPRTASTTPAIATHAFPRGAALAIVDGEGLRLRVVSGEVWITEEGSLVDLVIGAGESCPLTRPGSAVVEVQRDARLALEPQTKGATARIVRARMTRAGPWMLLHRRPSLLARAGVALDRALAQLSRWLTRSVVRPMIRARARRVLQVRY